VFIVAVRGVRLQADRRSVRLQADVDTRTLRTGDAKHTKDLWKTRDVMMSFRQPLTKFTLDELDYMQEVYTGMMDESIKNLDQLSLVINAFVTQMSDAKRMEIINEVDHNLDENLSDLREFNNQNKMMSLQRATEKGDIETVKKLYGL